MKKDFKEILEDARKQIDAVIEEAQDKLIFANFPRVDESVKAKDIISLRKILIIHMIEIWATYGDFGDCLPDQRIWMNNSRTKWVDIQKGGGK